MKIWLIERKTYIGYDEYDAHVVAADTDDVRTIITTTGDLEFKRFEYVGDEGTECWLDETKSRAECIGEGNFDVATVILSSFNPG